MQDLAGADIAVGDKVSVVSIDTGRGAQMWMGEGVVVGFGRTRLLVLFPSRMKPLSVGPECVRRIEAKS